MILEEFDPNKTAVFNPTDIINPVEGIPTIGVACYSYVTMGRMIAQFHGVQIAVTSNANMDTPVYKIAYKNVEIALFMNMVGASASAGILEDIFAMGVEKVIVFGTCGVLDASIGDCSIIIPDRAVRDEGTSFHYAQASDEIAVNGHYIEVFRTLLDEMGCSYTVGKVWTTDGIYRETRDKVERRKAQGCICVDMECSANAAVAQFRQKEVFQFFYAADNLDAEKWDERSLSNHANVEEKDRIAVIALELAVRM